MAYKFPFMKMFTGDWLRDTRVLTCAEKGFWWDCLAYMHEDDESGEIVGSLEDFGRRCGCSPKDAREWLSEIGRKGVADVTCHAMSQNVTNGVTSKVWIIRNRRMYRKAQERKAARKRKQRQRERETQALSRECPPDVTPPVTDERSEIRDQRSESDRKENVKRHSLSTQFVDCWNEMASQTNGKVRAIRGALRGKRLATLQTRLKDPAWRDQYAEAIAKIPTCAQLMGKVPGVYWEDKPVIVSWFLREEIAAKILEGAYDGQSRQPNLHGGSSNRTFESARTQGDKFAGD